MNYIFRIILIAVRDKVIPLNWCVTDGIIILRVQNPRCSNLADYRQIALRNIEGKLTKNNWIGTMFQKGSI